MPGAVGSNVGLDVDARVEAQRFASVPQPAAQSTSFAIARNQPSRKKVALRALAARRVVQAGEMA
eukprot:5513098-Alexandrium_andersonii.AAC.1